MAWLYDIFYYSSSGIEVNDDNTDERGGHLYSELAAEGARHPLLRLAETQGRRRGWEGNLEWKETALDPLRSEVIGAGAVEAGYQEMRYLKQLAWELYLAFSRWSYVGKRMDFWVEVNLLSAEVVGQSLLATLGLTIVHYFRSPYGELKEEMVRLPPRDKGRHLPGSQK